MNLKQAPIDSHRHILKRKKKHFYKNLCIRAYVQKYNLGRHSIITHLCICGKKRSPLKVTKKKVSFRVGMCVRAPVKAKEMAKKQN